MASEQITPGWVTYLRVSDEDKQTQERSFAMQRQRIQEHLLLNSSVPFFREYTDLLSGTNPNRKDYQQMLSDAEAGRFSHLGLYRSDRFGRNTVEGLQAATKLIGLGIKIRVAYMPSLRPEEPDGFFMFLIQMGMAQREVDVMRQRTRDGTEAKMRAGGWPNQAPEGYRNMERQIKSGKYERWIERDPKYHKPIREAWDLLLTGRYTLDQICEELTRKGYTRSKGAPWAWDTPRLSNRKTAKGRLQHIFHNPFYAGWVVSEPFGIQFGDIRGVWEPTVTTQEYEKGIEILLKHGANKSRFKRKHYLLRNLLWLEFGKKEYKMHGSTPSGRDQSYAYYLTAAKPNNQKMRLKTAVVDQQIPALLHVIDIEPDLIPTIKDTYNQQIKKATHDDRGTELESLQKKLASLENEEARLARLFVTGNINEATYTQLRQEWKEKSRNIQRMIQEMKTDTRMHLDDLEVALALMIDLPKYFNRLEDKKKTNLLQTIFKKIVVNCSGDIISFELHSPFTYLFSLANKIAPNSEEGFGSSQVLYRPQKIPCLWGFLADSTSYMGVSKDGKYSGFLILVQPGATQSVQPTHPSASQLVSIQGKSQT